MLDQPKGPISIAAHLETYLMTKLTTNEVDPMRTEKSHS